MKRRWPGRAISPSSNFARDIPKTPFPSGGQESSRKWLILFAISCQRAPATSPESPLTLPAEKRAVKEAVWFTLSSAPTASWPGPCLIRYAWSTARLTSAPSRLSPAKTRRISPLTRKLVSAHTDEEWVIAVDLQCGSPWNAAAGLAMRHPQIRVISGLSLPLALELVDNQHTLSADDLCQHLQAIASQCCVVWQQPETVEEEF